MVSNLLVLFSMVVTAMTMQAAVRVEKTEYKGWKNCYRVTNGDVEVIVTSDVGPRAICFASEKWLASESSERTRDQLYAFLA